MVFLALRHLLARKRQSLVTLMGIFIGTTAFIVISLFFRGVQDTLTDSLVSGDAHIKIQSRERTIDKGEISYLLFPEYDHIKWHRPPAGRRAVSNIENPPSWYERFDRTPNVIASTPVYSTSALILSNQTTYSLSVTGAKPSALVRVTNIQTKIVEGDFLDLEKGTGRIVIGKELADILAKRVGDNLVLTAPDGRSLPFKVVAVFSTGNQMGDRGSAYTSLADAQKIANASGRISQISVKIADYKQAAALSDEWKTTSFDKVQSWDQANENLVSIFRNQEIMRYMATGVIMLVAVFGIYNILNMVVTQKRKDIAILRSMGYEASDVVLLFLLQGFALGVIGGLLGCLTGYALGASFGTIHFGPGGGGKGFSMGFDTSIYLTALLISNAAALAASYFPARAAAKLTPIEIIRSGAV
jgi:lipoprotein-releasing system permease protein